MGLPATVEKRRYTVSEYLSLERNARERHEYRNGEIVAMAGGTYNHSLICANLIRELGNALKGKPCRVLDSNLRVATPRAPLYTYPDISVICGKPQFDPNDEFKETVLNPTLLVEVLSPSTEGFNRGEKFTRFRTLESFREYVLISQDVARAEILYRQEDGTWLFAAVSGMDKRIRLANVDIELSLAEIFAGVEFPPEEPEPTQPTAF